MNNKKTFTTQDENGNELTLAILRPSPKIQIESQLVYNREWRKAESNGSMLRMDIDEVAKKRGLWDDEKAKKVREIEDEILSLERKLRGGANELNSILEGKEVALKIRKLRGDRVELISARNGLDRYTAESFADTARIQYSVYATTVYNDTGKPYFKSYEDFLEKSNDKVAVDAMSNYIELMFEDMPKDQDTLYENKFLLKYNFCDDKYRLIDEQGRLMNEEGKLVDENGRYVNEVGEFVDRDGYRVDKEGEYIVEYKEFD